MTALKDIEKAELFKLLKDSSVLVVEGKNLSHLEMGTIDFTGKTFKDCDLTDTKFGDCVGLPTLENCTVNKEKATDVMVIKSKDGNLTIFSMIRGSNPYYVINGKEYGSNSAETAMVSQARRLASVVK